MFDQKYILNKYLIKEVKPDEEWNLFNNKSRNKSIFCDLDFLCLEKNKKKFFSIFKNKECVAKFFLLSTNDKKLVLPDELIFTPIIYRKISNSEIVSNNVTKNGILSGCHQDLKKNDLRYIYKIFDNFFKKKK